MHRSQDQQEKNATRTSKTHAEDVPVKREEVQLVIVPCNDLPVAQQDVRPVRRVDVRTVVLQELRRLVEALGELAYPEGGHDVPVELRRSAEDVEGNLALDLGEGGQPHDRDFRRG